MIIPLLLLGSFAMSIAAPTSSCDLTKVAIVGGNYTVDKRGIVVYACPKGQYPFPAFTRECQWNGKWTDENKKAACKAIECPRPVTFENGDYDPPQAKYFIGDILHFECWGGFKLKGSENRTCQENGKWSGETAICDNEEGHCHNPGIPIGTTKVGEAYRVEGKVTYQCQNNLKMLGSSTRVCKEDKTWSGTEPSCREFYSYDTPKEVAKEFGSSLSETIESSDPDRTEDIDQRKLKIRTGGPMNIFIICDASSSVGKINFNLAKEIVITFIEKLSSFDFTPRYSVLTYASFVKTIMRLSDDLNTDADAVIKEIEAFKYEEHEDKQGTNTRGALQEVYNQLSLDNENNPERFFATSNIIVLLTDGKHNMGGDPSVELNTIRGFLNIKDNEREEKLDIYVFGLGDDISIEEINSIASKKDKEKHAFRMESVQDLKKAFDDIIDETEAFEMCGLSKEYSEEDQEKFPWLAKITITRPDGVENCKGSIVTKNFILTAAHCFHLDEHVHAVTVQVGGSIRRVTNLHRHPNYNPIGKQDKNILKSFDFDLALVELDKKIDFSSKVRPICLPCTTATSLALKQRSKVMSCADHEKTLLDGNLVKALFITDINKNSIQQMDVLIKQGDKRQACIDDTKKVPDFKDVADITDVVTDNFLCTGGTEPYVDPQTCKGDSGGPLIVQYKKRYVQVGVISWGTINSCQGYKRKVPVPLESRDYHASVPKAVPWLKDLLSDELQYLQ